MFCVNCACELPAVAKFCVRCGSPVEPSTRSIPLQVVKPPVAEPLEATSAQCSKCGVRNPSDYSFCTACGAPLKPSGSLVFLSSTVTAFGADVSPATKTLPPPQTVGAETSIPSPLNSHDTADSKKATFLDSNEGPLRLCAIGDILVMPRDSILPARCVKCGNAPTEPWVKTTFSWHHPGYYFLLITPVLYVIVALIVRKTMKLSIPLCKAHKSIRKKRLWIGWILLVGCIPLPTALGVYIDNDAATMVAFWLGVGMFIAGLLFLVYASSLKATGISSTSAEFKGACPEFLTGLDSISANQHEGHFVQTTPR